MGTRKITAHLKSSLRKTQTRRARTRATTTLRRRRRRTAHATCSNRGMMINAKVSHKLETLKNLIPGGVDSYNGDNHHHRRTIKAEQLFQKTADYIILLRTRVLILQRLIQLYGSTCSDNVQDVNVL